jgi:hypothetical protein
MLVYVLSMRTTGAVGVSGLPEFIILNNGDYAEPSLLKTVTFTWKIIPSDKAGRLVIDICLSTGLFLIAGSFGMFTSLKI